MNAQIEILKNELKKLCSEDIDATVDALERFIIRKNDFTQVMGRYNRYKKNLHSDIITQEEKNNEINKISLAIEDIIDKLQEDNLNPISKDWLIYKLQTKKNNKVDLELKNFKEEIDKITSKVDKTGDELSSTQGKLNKSINTIAVILALLGLTAYLTHFFTKKGLEDKYTNMEIQLGKVGNDDFFLPSKGIYDIEESNVVQIDTFRQVMLEFWTPSVWTKKWLINRKRYSSIKFIPKRYLVSDDKHEINLFVDKIKNEFNVEGYSRFEAMGAGKEIPKPGWYWKLTINVDSPKGYSKARFLKIFQEHWERKHGIYLIETFLKQGTHFTAPKNKSHETN